MRLIVEWELYGTNPVEMDSIKDQIIALGVSEQTVRTGNENSPVLSIVSGRKVFADEPTADQLYDGIVGIAASSFAHGKVSSHWCPEDGEYGNWSGCSVDSRAKYKELKK